MTELLCHHFSSGAECLPGLLTDWLVLPGRESCLDCAAFWEETSVLSPSPDPECQVELPVNPGPAQLQNRIGSWPSAVRRSVSHLPLLSFPH